MTTVQEELNKFNGPVSNCCGSEVVVDRVTYDDCCVKCGRVCKPQPHSITNIRGTNDLVCKNEEKLHNNDSNSLTSTQVNFNDMPKSDQEAMIKGAVAKSKIMQDKVFSGASLKGLSKTNEDPTFSIDSVVDAICSYTGPSEAYKKTLVVDLIRAVGEEIIASLQDEYFHPSLTNPAGFEEHEIEKAIKLGEKRQRQKLEVIISSIQK